MLFAEDKQQSISTKNSTPKEEKSSPQSKKQSHKSLIPFAHFEEALKKSERWKAMSPEEQSEALEKIKQARQQFRKHEIERQKQYLPLLKQRPSKGRLAIPEYDALPDETEKPVQ